MRGLYIHIPFCVRKCAYCDFYSVSDRLDLLPAYIETLLIEANKYAGLSFDTLYLGGGTPSLLGAHGLRRLTAGLKKILDLTGLTEATVEVNPESALPDFYAAARECGINRVSVGIQSLADTELSDVGRIHTALEAIYVVKNARSTGFSEISGDVIVGLPGQTWESLRKTLGTLTGLGITHLSLYCLSLEEGTPLAGGPPGNLPSGDSQAELFERARGLLVASGFVHYEISNFALPGHECQHNLNYWRGGDYLGLGAAAASHLDGKRFKNRDDLDAYLEDPIAQVSDVEELEPEAKAAEEAILRLRLLREGLDINKLPRRYGEEGVSGLKKRLEALASDGLLTRDSSRYRIPPERVLTSNQVLVRVIGD